jgi:hypothetical protein
MGTKVPSYPAPAVALPLDVGEEAQ